MKDSVLEVKLRLKSIESMSLEELEEFKEELDGTCQALSYCIINCGHDGAEDLRELKGYFQIIDSRKELSRL